MSFAGSLRTLAPRQLLGWLAEGRRSGRLQLRRGARTRTFEVARGAVTLAGASEPAERLGQILVNLGHLDEAGLDRAFQTQAETGVRLGRVVTLVGLVAEADLRCCLELKIREGLLDVLGWPEGTFAFEPDAPPAAASEVEVAVALEPAIAEGAARAHAWRELRAWVAPDDSFYVADLDRADLAPPGSLTARVLGEVARARGAREIALCLHAMEFSVYEELHRLLRQGVLGRDRRDGRREGLALGEASPAELVGAARRHVRAGEDDAALPLLRAAVERAPEDPEARGELSVVERTLLGRLSAELLSRPLLPRQRWTQAVTDALGLEDDERYLLSRIDGVWDLASIVRVSPLRDVDALLALDRLHARGVITLGEAPPLRARGRRPPRSPAPSPSAG